jgi:bifunctional non-homologous end joining protein LigD
MGTHQEIALAYRAGSSDKVYNVGIYTKDTGFVVDFEYGRRGSTLQTGTKTAEPVPLAKATAIFDKLVGEKLAKGYSPGAAGVPYQHTDQEQRMTGIFPQLLNAVEDVDRFVHDDAYCAQEKFDGRRVMIRVGADGSVIGINRKGLVIALPEPIAKAATKLGKDLTIDGECIGDVFHAFDALTLNGKDIQTLPYTKRHYELSGVIDPYSSVIRLVETATSTLAKANLLKKLRENQREGIVFKLGSAPYQAGRPASGGPQLKHKFTATATCIVTKRNEGLRSVALGMENGPITAVGNVTIPPNASIPKVGDLVEIRYLNWQPGGSLYQPVYLGKRDDLDKPDSMATLKVKANEGAEDADES